MRKVLERCENKPLILVDGGPWFRWALQRLGLRYNHQTFGERHDRTVVPERWRGVPSIIYAEGEKVDSL